ncbi:MAG: hypothetical protein LBJ87_11830 [bacterium]|nr:hypothetical protein [bacterium]
MERWRDSDEFGSDERAALALAEAATVTPADVPDDVFAEARRHFDEKQMVELAATIGLENFRARFNRVFAVESQHFYERRRQGSA